MNSPTRSIRSSLAATTTPEASKARQREIESIVNPVKRAGLLAVNRMIVRRPELFASLLREDYCPSDLELLARRPDSDTYKKGHDEVIKVVRSSMDMTAGERRQRAAKMVVKHEAMSRFFGEFIVPQEISVRKHPILRGVKVVATTQGYVELHDPQLFQECRPELVSENLRTLQSQHPRAAAQLPEFVDRNQALYENTGLLVDTNGAGNLGVDLTTDRLLVIDGQPIGTEHPDIQAIILEQFNNLGNGLTIAA
jgi:hypothetical protein